MHRPLPAALAAALLCTAAYPAAAFDWSAEIYGGATLAREEAAQLILYDVDAGTSLGFGLYAERLVGGLSLGLDVMRTRASYSDVTASTESLSIMAVLRKDFAIGQAVEGYVSAGVGGIRVGFEASTITASGTVPGAQIGLGFRQALSSSSKLFVEMKHQFAFEDFYEPGVVLQSYAATSVLLGLQFAPNAGAASSATPYDWSAEIYGGATLARSENFLGSDYDLDQGRTLGVGIYADGAIRGMEVGLDVMNTRAAYSGFEDEENTLSFMAVLRKSFPIGQTVDGYVAGGLGAIRTSFGSDLTEFSDLTPGAQVAIGLRHSFGVNTSVFGEVKYQAALDDAETALGYTQSYASTNVLVGVKFGF